MRGACATHAPNHPAPMIACFRRLILPLSLASLSALPFSAQAQDVPYVDILVVYTPSARAAAGSPTAMANAINSYVALANTCFTNSAMATRLRLVGTAEVAYTETFGGTMNTDLNWLGTASQTPNTTLNLLRRATGADLVCLVRRDTVGGTTGVADGSTGCLVVADNHAIATMAFPHEIGHAMGARHDRASEGNPTYGYSYGYQFTGNDNVQYRTVMANGSGTRIPYFSNPTVTYQGVATGVAAPAIDAADNAQNIDNNLELRSSAMGVGDALIPGRFSGDSTAEFILASTNFQCRYWEMTGATRTSATEMAEIFTAVWTVFGAGDLDGDGKDDLLFSSGDGHIAVWFMNGSTRTSAAVLPDTFIPANWTPIGAGDLNSDGKADLVFAHWDGRIAVWYMNGTTRTSAAVLADTFSSSALRLAAVGDLDGNGSADLLFWGGSPNRITIWFMTGSTRNSTAVTADSFATIWRPAGAADCDGDGKADIVFRSFDSRGAVWFMNGATRTGSAVLSHELDLR